MPLPQAIEKTFAIYLKSNTDLVSIATESAMHAPLPAHVDSIEIANFPGPDDVWNKAQKKFITQPHVPTTKELLLAKNSNAWSDKDIADALKILLSGNPNP